MAVIEIGYTINWAAARGAAAMPKAAADCLRLSSGIAAKVFIYITAVDGAETEEIAEAIDVSAEDVNDALLFWERAGLLLRRSEKAAVKTEKAVERGESASANQRQAASSGGRESASARRGKPASIGGRESVLPRRPTEIAAAAKKNTGITDVFRAAEKIFARPLRHTETRVFAALLEELNISPDILIMIIDFADSAGKYSAAYIDAIARDWAERGITAHGEAEAEILRIRELNTLELQVKTRFGLNQTLTKSQKNYVKEWADKGYTIEMIMTAFDSTVDRINKADFKYITKVLANDKAEGAQKIRGNSRQKADPSFSYGDFGEKTIERILRETEEVYV
jgi:DnaD/phage-associated family protein